MKIRKLYKPQRVGNSESVIAYSGEEVDPDEQADAEEAVYIDFIVSSADTTDSQSPGSPAWADSMERHAPGLEDAPSPIEFLVGPALAGGRVAGAGARVVARTIARESAEEAAVTTGQEVGGSFWDKIVEFFTSD